jgi:hypothetical protein
MLNRSKERPVSETTGTPVERLRALLDRLDIRVSEPCTVPGCVHLHTPPAAVPLHAGAQRAA